MKFALGIKSDPIQYRYSFDWLFEIMKKNNIKYIQFGSFFEIYTVEDNFFKELRKKSEDSGIIIKSAFTTHRELGGFFTGNKYLEKSARLNYEKFINAVSLLGADYAGTNPGSVLRDRMELKDAGIKCYIKHIKELMEYAKLKGLKGLTMEPMSSHAEPPSLPEELDYMINELNNYHKQHADATVPVYFCGDISHGVADINQNILHDNLKLFKHEIPNMCEFHFKNTDKIFHTTFGFSDDEIKKGIIDLNEIKNIILQGKWPVEEVIGYFETGGPKLGRDYTDFKLESMINSSFINLRKVFEV